MEQRMLSVRRLHAVTRLSRRLNEERHDAVWLEGRRDGRRANFFGPLTSSSEAVVLQMLSPPMKRSTNTRTAKANEGRSLAELPGRPWHEDGP